MLVATAQRVNCTNCPNVLESEDLTFLPQKSLLKQGLANKSRQNSRLPLFWKQQHKITAVRTSAVLLIIMNVLHRLLLHWTVF